MKRQVFFLKYKHLCHKNANYPNNDTLDWPKSSFGFFHKMLGNISGRQNFGHTDFLTNWVQQIEISHWKHKFCFVLFFNSMNLS